jgi:uncharacterized protein YdcH (DUF465 family)
MTDQRFDRIEEKIDKLTEAITQIVRVEEKLLANDKRVDRLEYRTDLLETEIDDVAAIARNNSGVVKFADKFFWLVVGGGVSLVVWVMKAGVA